MQALGALLELARGLRAAEHEHAQHRELVLGQTERLVEQVAVLGRAAARSAGQARPAPPREAVQRVADDRLVVLDDRIAVGRLVARQAQGVEAQGIGLGRGALLLEQAAEDADLGRAEVHGHAA